MATPKTAADLAAAAAKRAATRATNKAAGVSVRAQRAAAKAAKAGIPYTPPAPKAPSASAGQGSTFGYAPRRGRRRTSARFTPAQQPSATAPIFATVKPNYRALQLNLLVAVEALFIQKQQETGITQEARDAYAKYQLLKVRALAPSTGGSAAVNTATQNEADTALRVAIIHLIKQT